MNIHRNLCIEGGNKEACARRIIIEVYSRNNDDISLTINKQIPPSAEQFWKEDKQDEKIQFTTRNQELQKRNQLLLNKTRQIPKLQQEVNILKQIIVDRDKQFLAMQRRFIKQLHEVYKQKFEIQQQMMEKDIQLAEMQSKYHVKIAELNVALRASIESQVEYMMKPDRKLNNKKRKLSET